MLAFQKFTLILLSLAIVTGNGLSSQSSIEKRVLYINSYHRGYVWSDLIEDGIRKELGAGVDITTAYLDAKRSDYDRLLTIEQALIKAKLEQKPVDLIITSDNPAFDFVIENRARFLEGIPLVACGLNYLSAEDLRPYSNLTAVAEIGDPLGNIQIGLDLFPEAKEILILDDSATAKSVQILQQVHDTYGEQFDIRVVSTTPNDSTESILENIQATDVPKIIIQFGVSPAVGLNLEAYELRNITISKVPFPIFVTFEASIVADVLGGACQDPMEQGRITARIAQDILNGKNPDDIPPVLENVEKVVFNYQALKKFHLKPSVLPSGYTLINAPEDKYVLIWKYLMIALGVIGGLSIVLSVLLYEVFRRKKAEKSLVVALKKVDEASQAKSSFMRVMSHELFTPMNSIIGYSNLLEDEPEDKIRRDYIEIIQRHSNHLLKLIKQILAFTNFDSASTTINKCKPKLLLKQLSKSHKEDFETKGLLFNSSISGNQRLLPVMNCEIVGKVIDLLLDNAVKFSDSGSVSVNLRLPDRYVRKGGVMTIEVSDEGIGISPEDIPYIFQPFHQVDGSTTRRHGGVGLGLATCKKLIDSVDGTIHCRSEMNKGTTFTLLIPCEFVKKNKKRKKVKKTVV